MLTRPALWHRIKLREAEPDTNGLMRRLSIVRHALSAREWLHCQSIVSSLGSPFQHPRFARYTVPEHCLGPRCPLSQTGMTWARCLLPKLKCHRGWHCLGGGVWQTDHAILHQRGGQSKGWINKHDVGGRLVGVPPQRQTNMTRWSNQCHSVFMWRPCRFVRDERSHHLHGDESGVGAREELLRLLLHPGVGRLPVGADQRTHLRHLEEARMSHHSIQVCPENPLPNCQCHQSRSEI